MSFLNFVRVSLLNERAERRSKMSDEDRLPIQMWVRSSDKKRSDLCIQTSRIEVVWKRQTAFLVDPNQDRVSCERFW